MAIGMSFQLLGLGAPPGTAEATCAGRAEQDAPGAEQGIGKAVNGLRERERGRERFEIVLTFKPYDAVDQSNSFDRHSSCAGLQSVVGEGEGE